MKMKKLQSIFMMLIAAAISMTIASCSGNDAPQPEPISGSEKECYEVSLNMTGDFTEISEEIMTKAGDDTSKKYYGINVYFSKEDEDTYTFYGYGTFDNVSDMKITLFKGFKYKFECSAVVDGDDKIPDYPTHYFYNSLSYNSENQFKVVNEKNLGEDYIGRYTLCNLKNGDNYARRDRFYGELTDFIPSKGGVANIALKRTAFGIKVKVNKIPNGILGWTIDRLFNDKTCSADGVLEQTTIYSFNNIYDCWKSSDTYSEDFTVTFNWTRTTGEKMEFSKAITAKRNVLTTINVSLTEGIVESENDVTIGIQEESTVTNNDITVDFD